MRIFLTGGVVFGYGHMELDCEENGMETTPPDYSRPGRRGS